MRRGRNILVVVLLIVSCSLFSSQLALAREGNATRELIRVLYQNKNISAEQYKQLLEQSAKDKSRASQGGGLEKTGQEKKGAEAREPKQLVPGPMAVYWENGLYFDQRDEKFKLKLGGRLLNDWTCIDADRDVKGLHNLDKDRDFGSGTEFRQARVYLRGTLHDKLMFKLQYEFARGETVLKKAWMGLKEIPWVGNIKLGHFKEPFSLEYITSRKYLSFMEKSLRRWPRDTIQG